MEFYTCDYIHAQAPKYCKIQDKDFTWSMPISEKKCNSYRFCTSSCCEPSNFEEYQDFKPTHFFKFARNHMETFIFDDDMFFYKFSQKVLPVVLKGVLKYF